MQTKTETMTERLVEVSRDNEIPVEEQTNFFKLKVGARAIYISKSGKTPRVDLSGFDFEHPAVRTLGKSRAKKLKLGKIKAQLDFLQGEEVAMEAFSTAIHLMKHLAHAPTKVQKEIPARIPVDKIPELIAAPGVPGRKRSAKHAS